MTMPEPASRSWIGIRGNLPDEARPVTEGGTKPSPLMGEGGERVISTPL